MKEDSEKLLNLLSEEELCQVAEIHPDDKEASKAMRMLRTKFDKSYIWCYDCDGLVIKESECCLNKECKAGDNFEL